MTQVGSTVKRKKKQPARKTPRAGRAPDDGREGGGRQGRKGTGDKIAWLASFPEKNPMPVVELDLDSGAVQYLNPAADRLFPELRRLGLRHPFLEGLESLADLLEQYGGGAARREVAVGDCWYEQSVHAHGGRHQLRVYALEISDRIRKERDLQRLHRTLVAHNKTSHAMMRATDEAQYLDEVCKIVVEDCGHAMVWVGYAEEDEAQTVRPVAHAGFEEGYLDTLNITWADTERGRGPTGTAVRSMKPTVCRNMATDPRFAPWREDALKRGYASSIALPLITNERAFGAITIYSRAPEAFSDEDVALLTDLADDLAFGITAIRLRRAHAEAEEALRESEERYRSLFDNMLDGFAYCHMEFDKEQPRDFIYLAVNGAFETLTGLKNVVGRKVTEVIPGIREADPQLFEIYGRAARTGVPERFETYVEALKMWFSVSVYGTGDDDFVALFDMITERKRAEQELAQQRATLEAVLESSEGPIFSVDRSYCYTSFNARHAETMKALFGAEIKVGHNILEYHSNPKDRLAAQTNFDRVFRGESVNIESLAGEEGRTRRYFEISHNPVRGSDGQVTGVAVYARDLTERKRAEEALAAALGEARRRTEEVSALLATSRAVLRQRSFTVTAKEIFDSCKELLGATGGYVALATPDESKYDQAYLDPGGLSGPFDLDPPLEIRDLRAEACRSRRTLVENNLPARRRADALAPGQVDPANVLFAPLVIHDEAMGVLCLSDKPNGFGDDDIRLATAFAEMASVALLNSRTLELLEENQVVLEGLVAERTQQLEAERLRLESVLETMQDSVCIISRDQRVEYINPAARRQFGDIDGRPCYALLHGRDEPCPWCHKEQVFAGEQHRWEWAAPGTGKTYEAFATRLHNAGGSFSKLEIFHDVSERKEAENALRDERQRLFGVLDQLPAFVYLRREDASVVFANRYFREEFGELDGRKCYEILGRSETPCEGCDFSRVFRDGQAVEREWIAPNGKSYQVHHYPFVDSDGTRLALALGVNITDRKLAYEAELVARKTAETLREASLGLTRTLDVDAVLFSLLRNLRRLVPFDRAKVMLLSGDQLSVRAVLDVVGSVQILPQPRPSFHPSENPVIESILTLREAVLIPDIHEHPSFGPRADPAFEHCWLGVPLIARGTVVGMYSLGKRDAGSITLEHQQLAEALSAQAAVAVQNALLFEQVQAASARMQTLSRRLVEVQETERRTIARELHDEASQSLTSLLFGLRLLEKDLAENDAALARISELKRTTDAVMEDLHRLATDLRPASLEHLGLVGALRQHLVRIESTSGIAVRFMARGLEDERLPNAVETTIFRVVQEALTNVLRHARASRVDVLAERRGDRLIVVVEDDGVGFDPERVDHGGRLGRVGMRERAEALGGTLTVESSPGAGTTVAVEVPHVDSRAHRR